MMKQLALKTLLIIHIPIYINRVALVKLEIGGFPTNGQFQSLLRQFTIFFNISE